MMPLDQTPSTQASYHASGHESPSGDHDGHTLSHSRLISMDTPASVENPLPATANTIPDARTPRPFEQPEALADLFQPRGVPCILGDGSSVTHLWTMQGLLWMAQKAGNGTVRMIADVVIAFERAGAEKALLEPSASPLSNARVASFPPLPEMLSLIQLYFSHFHPVTPLFHEATFMQNFHDHVVLGLPAGPGVVACMHLVVTLARRVRNVIDGAYTVDAPAEPFCPDMEAIRRLLPDILVAPPQLANAQALVGMVSDWPVPSPQSADTS